MIPLQANPMASRFFFIKKGPDFSGPLRNSLILDQNQKINFKAN
jgi:hypothetical protein